MPHLLGIRKNPEQAPSLVDPGQNPVFLGDSQTLGRAYGEAISHASAWCWIWQNMRAANRIAIGPATPYATFPTNPYRNGESGRSLANTIAAYAVSELATVRANATMVWVQESGNQNWDGQRTPAEFIATYLAFWRWIHSINPLAQKFYESAFSFGREVTNNTNGRDWNLWNLALIEANATLALEGIIVHLVPTDAAVKALQIILTPAAVWYQDGDDAYHYTPVGNTLVAVLGIKKMGITCIPADLAGISGVTDTEKQHIIDVVSTF